MSGARVWVAMGLVVLLAGCDGDQPAPAQRAQVPAAAPPVVKPPAAAVAPLRLDPLPANAFVLPAAPPKKPQLARLKPPAKPKPAVVVTPAPRALDLSVPRDLTGEQPGVARRGASRAAEQGILPPLFHGAAPGRFQLGGRVLNRERSDDFEGAEVEIRFRQ